MLPILWTIRTNHPTLRSVEGETGEIGDAKRFDENGDLGRKNPHPM